MARWIEKAFDRTTPVIVNITGGAFATLQGYFQSIRRDILQEKRI